MFQLIFTDWMKFQVFIGLCPIGDSIRCTYINDRFSVLSQKISIQLEKISLNIIHERQ